MSNMLRNLPSVSELLDSPPLKSLVNRVSSNVLVGRVRRFLDDMRTQVQSAAANVHVPAALELAQRIADWISAEQPPSIVPVINATGIIVNDELGGLPLADEAIQAIAATARGYASVCLDLATGESCESVREAEQLLTRLTGAEAATVVATSPAAVEVAIAALAGSREVIVSRGELGESEDGFRLQEAILAGGAIGREVGSANRTRIEDYSGAISAGSAAILRASAGNAALTSGPDTPTLADLVSLGRKNGLTVMEWLENAALLDLAPYGILGTSSSQDSIKQGSDLVVIRGDRLLGGPPCGIILGKRELIDRIANHRRMNACRVDKLALAALTATLRLYQDRLDQDKDLTERAIPLLSLISTPLENLRQRAERLAPQIAATGVATVEIQAAQTFLTNERIPHQALPTISLTLTPMACSAEQLAARLRMGTPPLVGRIEEGRLRLDLRSVQPRDDLSLVAAIEAQRGVSMPERAQPAAV
jgi:L-seryl-tRNA(Ser) seleniumtransferase